MTTQEALVHRSSKHRWLIAFGLLLGLVPDIQLHTFCSVSQYGILKRCCKICKIGVQSDATSSNHFPTAMCCSLCFLSPTITSVLPFPFYLHLAPSHFLFPSNSSSPLPYPTLLSDAYSSAGVNQHWYIPSTGAMSAKNLADTSCLKCRNSVSHPCLLLGTLCPCVEACAWRSPSLPPHPVKAWTMHRALMAGKARRQAGPESPQEQLGVAAAKD